MAHEKTESDRTAEVELLPHQWEALTCSEPFVALVTGLGGGKTFIGARWLIMRALRYPKSKHLVTGNSYGQIADVILPELFAACEQLGIRYLFNATRNNLILRKCKAVIRIRSTEKYNLLRGPEYGSWWADEVRDASEDAIKVVIGRLRCRKVDRPRYLWTTTPAGFNHIWKRHVEQNDPKCRLIQATSIDNPHLTDDYIDTLKSTYASKMLEQEMQGAFVTLHGARAYYNYNRISHRKPCPLAPDIEVHVTLDFNVSQLVAIIGQVIGNEIRASEEIVVRDGSLEMMGARIAARFKDSSHAKVIIHGDATGHARNVQTGKSTYAILMHAMAGLGARVKLDTLTSNPAIVDRINSVNWLFGQNRAFVDPSCVVLNSDLERVHWKDNGDLEKSDIELTHSSDAFGYWVIRHHGPNAFKPQPRHGMGRTDAKRTTRRA